jgi:hypothetical protein
VATTILRNDWWHHIRDDVVEEYLLLVYRVSVLNGGMALTGDQLKWRILNFNGG